MVRIGNALDWSPLASAGRRAAAFALALAVAGCTQPTTTETASTAPGPAADKPTPASTQAGSGGQPTTRTVEKLSAKDVMAKIEGASQPVVVANFWATWCPPCVEEMPELAEFYEAYHGKGVSFFSFSADHPSTLEETVIPFLKQKDVPFPVAIVDEPNPNPLLEVMDVDWNGALPATFVYDRDRKVVKAWYQQITLEELETTVDPLLEAGPEGSTE